MSEQTILSWTVGSKKFPGFQSKDLRNLKNEFGENIVTENDWKLGLVTIHLIYSGVETTLRERMEALTPGLEPKSTNVCNLPSGCFLDQTEARH